MASSSSTLRQPLRLLGRAAFQARSQPVIPKHISSRLLSSSSAQPGQALNTQRWRRVGATAATVGGFVALTLLLNPISLDADHPANPLKNSTKKTKGKSSPPKAEDVEGTTQPSGQKLISFEEMQKHNSPDDLWVLIDGFVYDVTDFVEMHPGGKAVLYQNAGKDATEVYKPIHPPGTLENNLAPEAFIGPIDPTTVPDLGPKQLTADEKRMRNAREDMPPLDAIINLTDIADVAEKVLSKTAWNYYRSAADSEETYRNNANSYSNYEFRPRVLRSASEIDTASTMLGIPVTLPAYISPAAMARLSNPEGERNLTRAAGDCGIIQAISNNASCSLEEMLEVRKDDQALMFQIYLNRDRSQSEKLLHQLEDLRKEGAVKGLFFTVDAAVSSKRTLDLRGKAEVSAPNGEQNKSPKAAGVAKAISGYQDPNLTWDDIAFIRKNTELPIVIKGIQSLEDAELAAEHGVAGIILSTHGARQINYGPNPLDLLYEIRMKKPELFKKMEVFVDGGVREGAHVVMALALGAKGVGLGRLPLYANGTYGLDGLKKMYEILQEEVRATMGMCGARSIDELTPDMVRRKTYYDRL